MWKRNVLRYFCVWYTWYSNKLAPNSLLKDYWAWHDLYISKTFPSYIEIKNNARYSNDSLTNVIISHIYEFKNKEDYNNFIKK